MIDFSKNDFAVNNFCKNIVTWKRLVEEAKGNEDKMAIFALPEPIIREYKKPGSDGSEVIKMKFTAMTMLKLPSGQNISNLVRFDENGKPLFGASADIMKLFVEERKPEESNGN